MASAAPSIGEAEVILRLVTLFTIAAMIYFMTHIIWSLFHA